MLTNSELVLGAAGIGVLGTALGGVLSWLAGGATARTQWKHEQLRRRADRRAQLYEDMLAETDGLMRAQQQAHAQRPENAPGAQPPDKDLADRKARYEARVMLFGSRKVHTLWSTWFDIFAENWIPVDDSDYPAWKERMEVAVRALTDRMRTEVDPW